MYDGKLAADPARKRELDTAFHKTFSDSLVVEALARPLALISPSSSFKAVQTSCFDSMVIIEMQLVPRNLDRYFILRILIVSCSSHCSIRAVDVKRYEMVPCAAESS